VFQILKSFASADRVAHMRERLLRGTGYGYGHAKNDLIDAHREAFGAHQEAYEHFSNSPAEMSRLLSPGRERAAAIAGAVCQRARTALSLKSLRI
jgi:tryptophanyl-tRNA synthetase